MELILPEGAKKAAGLYAIKDIVVKFSPAADPKTPHDIDIEGLLTLQELVRGHYLNAGTPLSQGQARLLDKFNRLIQSGAACTSQSERVLFFAEAVKTLVEVADHARLELNVQLEFHPDLAPQ